MHMRLIDFADLPATPWKNGGGVTRELACYPPGASFDDFLWRVSIADVSKSGPFSTFPGIDRIIALLEGEGMDLQFEDGESHALTEPCRPFRFRGEDRLHAELAAPSRDFNLMLRREAVNGTLTIWRDACTLICEPGFLLLFCAEGRWEVQEAGGTRHQLGRHQTLCGACGESALAIVPLQAAGAMLSVRVNQT